MAVPNHFLFLWILLYASVLGMISSYTIFDAAEECSRDGTVSITLGTGNANSSGILRASRDGRQLPDMNCRITLKSPLSSEIVISVRRIDLMPPNSCDNYLELNSASDIRVRLCGYLFDKNEMQSYCSVGDVDLTFHTQSPNNYSSIFQTTQFEIIFTAVNSAWLRKCRNEEALCKNGRCIWEGLVNDGHNNCGDFSDEITFNISQKNKLTAGVTLAVVIPLIVLSLGLIILLMYCFGDIVTKKIERLIQNGERRNEVRNALINSSSTARRQGYNTVAGRQGDNTVAGRQGYNTVAGRQGYNTVAGRQDAVRDSGENPPAPRHVVNAAVHDREERRARFVPERTVNNLSARNVAKNDEKDLQPPPYEPPPSYESVTTQTKQKY